jgi:glycine betaine/proline transport system substrate-binding protein
LIVLLSSLSTISLLFSEGAQDKPQKLVFADLSWDSVMVHNRIAAYIIENGLEGDYEIDFMSGATAPTLTAMANGDIQINMESWHSNVQNVLLEYLESGSIIDLGPNLPDAPQGWYLPRYMIEGDSERGIEPIAPGLTSIDELNKYWELFKDPENPEKGLIYLGVTGWAVTETNEEVFDSYNLGEVYNKAIPGSATAVAATMDGAYRQGKPWIGYWWEPTPIMGRLDMVRLPGTELPPVLINVLINPELLDTAPDVVEFLENYNTTVAMNNEFLSKMEELDTDAEGAAIWFLKNREDVWTTWVSSSTAEKVKSALSEI